MRNTRWEKPKFLRIRNGAKPLYAQLHDLKDTSEEIDWWEKHLKLCNKIVKDYAKKRARKNKTKGGKPMSVPPGT